MQTSTPRLPSLAIAHASALLLVLLAVVTPLCHAQDFTFQSAVATAVDNRAGATTTYSVAPQFAVEGLQNFMVGMRLPDSLQSVHPTYVEVNFYDDGPSAVLPRVARKVTCPIADIEERIFRCVLPFQVNGTQVTSSTRFEILNIINAPIATGLRSAQLVVSSETGTETQRSAASWSAIVAGTLGGLTFTPSAVVASFTTSYTIEFTQFQTANVGDKYQFVFPLSTTQVGTTASANISTHAEGGGTLSDCAYTPGSVTLTCTISTVGTAFGTGKVMRVIATNLIHPPSAVVASAVQTRVLLVTGAATPQTRDQNITGTLTTNIFAQCALGRYSPTFNGTCFDCDAGTISTALSSPSCTQCAPGKIAATKGLSVCTNCNVGTYAKNPGSSVCLGCERGKYSPEPGTPECIPCARGSATNNVNSTICTVCPINTFTGEPGMFECAPCAEGFATKSSNSSSCDYCVKGRYRNGNLCSLCPGGGFTADITTQTICTPCTVGRFAPIGATTCTDCQDGKIAAAAQSSVCTDCPAGKVGSDPRRVTCTNCTAGRASKLSGLSVCEICTQGKFSQVGSSVCTECPVGRTAAQDEAGECTSCPMGQFMDVPGQAACKTCIAGRYTNETESSICRLCDAGKFGPSPNSPGCTECPTGKYTNVTSRSVCTDCDAGLKAPGTGNTECRFIPDGCDPGRYTVLEQGTTTCVDCPMGRFNPVYDKYQCEPCGLGLFQNLTGTTECQTCTSGTFTNTTGQTQCRSCEAGRFNTISKATTCTNCGVGQSTPAVGYTICSDCGVGTYSSVSGSLCIGCAIGKFQTATGATTCSNCPTLTSTAVTGASRLSHCLTVKCPELTFTPESHLSATYTSSVGVIGVGSVARLSCESGYALVGTSTRTCRQNPSATDATVGFWSGENPVCMLVQNNANAVVAKLEWSIQPPATVTSAEPWPLFPQVVLRSASNELVTRQAASKLITLKLYVPASITSSVAGGVRLRGTTAMQTVNGVASFADLSTVTLGTGFIIEASAPGLPSVNSTAFNVVAGSPSKLVIVAPVRVLNGVLFPSTVSVSLADSAGHLLSEYERQVTLGVQGSDFWIRDGPVGTTMTVKTVNGVATFPNLIVRTSRTLGPKPESFKLYATCPDFPSSESIPIQLWGTVEDNRASRYAEFARSVVTRFKVAIPASRYSTEALLAILKNDIRLDVCSSLGLSTSGCERVRVTNLTPNSQQGVTEVQVQIDAPTKLSTAAIQSSPLGAFGYERIGLAASAAASSSSSSSYSASSSDLVTVSPALLDFHGGSSSLGPHGATFQLLEDSAVADAATTYELSAQLSAQLQQPTSALYLGAVTSNAVGSSFVLDTSGTSLEPTAATFADISEPTTTKPLERTWQFILGMCLGLGAGGALIIGAIYWFSCRVPPISKPKEEDIIVVPAKGAATGLNGVSSSRSTKSVAHPSTSTMAKYASARPKAVSGRSKIQQAKGFDV